MTDHQPEPLIRADELEAIGAESSLARAMAAHTIRLLYEEKGRLDALNAELVEALKFCAGTSYITDAHEIAEAALAKAKEQK